MTSDASTKVKQRGGVQPNSRSMAADHVAVLPVYPECEPSSRTRTHLRDDGPECRRHLGKRRQRASVFRG